MRSVARAPVGTSGRLVVEGTDGGDRTFSRSADLVLVSVGVRPDTELLLNAGVTTGPRVPSLSTSRCEPGYPMYTPPGTAW